MSSLPTALRHQLESAVSQARKIAEDGARHALEALAVHEPDPYRHMDEGRRALRRQLRAQARQLGDGESRARPGAYEIRHLIEKLAYDQWHRLLFARYLLENNLLISPEHGVSVSLDDCEELAPSFGLRDAWAVAARFAAKELPDIFRADDPTGAVDLSVDDRQPLIALVTGLPTDVFTASDSLGWCYQFWQAEKKDEVNAAANKIGADELPAVTQLFTEDYMVDFLLDNTLGAWHAGKVLQAIPSLAATAQSEEELRSAVALPGCPWTYLRFTKDKDGNWSPAAGSFSGWPKSARDLKCLDPCMGSGHFVVAMFGRLVALRVAEERIDEATAATAVVERNLFGLEIDPRCTQIGAFNLALAAWRRVGHCQLPQMNIACSGLTPNARSTDWLAIVGSEEKLKAGMDRLYRLFADAPILGSLINPHVVAGDLLEAGFAELQPLLAKALLQETTDHAAHEMAVTAQGLAKAAEILAGQFTLVATNVPFLATRRQSAELIRFLHEHHRTARYDLATAMIERCTRLLEKNGTVAVVSPHNWLFLGSFTAYRTKLLEAYRWNAVSKLGSGAFETISGEVVNVCMAILSTESVSDEASVFCCDVQDSDGPARKAAALGAASFQSLKQTVFESVPDCRIAFDAVGGTLLSAYASGLAGIINGDAPRFERYFTELPGGFGDLWHFEQGTILSASTFGGREKVLFYDKANGHLREEASVRREKLHDADQRGKAAWKRRGVCVSLMGDLLVSMYLGDLYDQNTAVVLPNDDSDAPAIWTFCESGEFSREVRAIDQAIKVTNSTLVKVPFELARWQRVAKEKYPRGLPQPFSSDPTQWLFNGHPKESDQPLHVAMTRLLGYSWPRQSGSSFPGCPALSLDGLEKFSDGDGIITINATKGEGTAAERLRELLAGTYGKDWSGRRQDELLTQVDYAGASLEDWLRDGFFEQHCALFHSRPFIWHLWDGHKSGFSALVNYHKLTHSNLEKLTYAHLGDWIRRQHAAVDAGESGSDARLAAAKTLQARLKLILEGEPPYDLFVRWKPLASQAIGWYPDLNDGVRMNIRPFLAKDIPGGRKGAGILRAKPNIKWDKDRGKEPVRDKKEFPWFWGWDGKTQDFVGVGKQPDGNRWNDCHYSGEFKRKVRAAQKSK